jgi:hypothetical protein
MHRKLFVLNLTDPEQVRAKYAILSDLSRRLSAGNILNVCVNAIHAGSLDPNPAKWSVTQMILERGLGVRALARRAHLH